MDGDEHFVTIAIEDPKTFSILAAKHEVPGASPELATHDLSLCFGGPSQGEAGGLQERQEEGPH